MIEKVTQCVASAMQRLKLAALKPPILVVLALLLALLGTAPTRAHAQRTPGPDNSGKAEQMKGLQLYTRFEGSSSSDGQIMDINASSGYNFNRYLGVGLGVPLYFVRTSTDLSRQRPSSASGTGIGNIYANARLNLENPILSFASTITGNAPTGDSNKGHSTGQWTWTWDNSFSHDFDHFSPFVDVSLGNTINNTAFQKHPFTTLGHVANLEGGLNIGVWRSLNFSASLYDVEPWGPQTLYSFFVRRAGTLTGSSNPRDYQRFTVVSGAADLAKDNGYNLGATLNPTKVIDFSFGFSHSVRLQLNTFTWGVGFNLTSLLRHATFPH